MTPIEQVRSLLATASTDTEYRTVASRAYFAVYWAAISIAELQGFHPDKTGDDHRRLIAFLKTCKSQLLVRIGHHRLPRLRSLRNSADYDRGRPFTEGMAEEAVQTAEEIIGWIESLTTGHP